MKKYIVFAEPCHVLPGVGVKLAQRLSQCGIVTVADLMFHLPYRYQDRTRVLAIRDARPQDWAVMVGHIERVDVKQGRRKVLMAYLSDGTGRVKITFFHFHAHQLEDFQTGVKVRVFGECRGLPGQLEMVHPEYRLEQNAASVELDETLTPIYSLTQGLTQHRLRSLVQQALAHYACHLPQLEWMPQDWLQRWSLLPMHEALRCLHAPPPDISLEHLEQGQHPALRRLVFEELLVERMSMELARCAMKNRQATACLGEETLTQALLDQLPFQLTRAQTRVLDEIKADLAESKPMLRLVQGDVGSGKTVVAAWAIMRAVASGLQVAFMAPTDLLTEQHAQQLKRWFEPLGVTVEHLKGKLGVKKRRQVLADLQSGQCSVVVGTHALFQDKVVFQHLGLVVIDEQHRFGVEQRLALVQKGSDESRVPHQLLMTATPIPRTLRMTQWAHLDVSIIDELPPTRTPVVTAVMSQEKRDHVLTRLRQAVHEGRQAYWVCTLIEESETLQCQAAIDTAQQLCIELAPIRVGLVHGRMKPEEKDAILQAFRAQDLDILVATTVIEVGVDVPNASVMIIENAERLGLAQLHQLRGRVGRGAVASSCVLMYQAPLSEVGRSRLHTMRETTDGFEIAEQDLILRGGGEVLGTRQTGYKTYKIAQLARDQAMLPQVAQVAKELVQKNPALAQSISHRWAGQVENYLTS